MSRCMKALVLRVCRVGTIAFGSGVSFVVFEFRRFEVSVHDGVPSTVPAVCACG